MHFVAAVGPAGSIKAPAGATVVDGRGMAVANTFTLNTSFGALVQIPGTGVMLNNEMDDFTAKVGVPNLYGLVQGEANAIAPGKRPLSSMSPTILSRDGKPVVVVGTPGGSRSITAVMLSDCLPARLST